MNKLRQLLWAAVALTTACTCASKQTSETSGEVDKTVAVTGMEGICIK